MFGIEGGVDFTDTTWQDPAKSQVKGIVCNVFILNEGPWGLSCLGLAGALKYGMKNEDSVWNFMFAKHAKK